MDSANLRNTDTDMSAVLCLTGQPQILQAIAKDYQLAVDPLHVEPSPILRKRHSLGARTRQVHQIRFAMAYP